MITLAKSKIIIKDGSTPLKYRKAPVYPLIYNRLE